MELNELNEIELSGKALCEILDFKNSNYLSELVKDHGFIRSVHGKYPFLKNIKRFVAYQQELHDADLKKIRESNSHARLETAQAGIKELELKEKQNELGPVREFELALRNEASLYKKGLDALKSRLKFDLNLNPEQTTELEKQINGLLNQIANLPADTNAESVTL